MASKEDDNKLWFNSNVNNDRQVNIINVYKRLEFVLNNKTESFPNKVESLVQVWKQVSQCRLTEHKQYVVHLMDWLKLHTLNIVLTGDWKKFKDIYEEKLLKEVKHCEMLLLHSNNIFSLRCRKLAEVIKDPWGSPILNRLLNDPDVVIGPQEIEFFCIETGYLISTRLRKLCESHCEDLALNLVSTFMRCHQMAEAQHFSLNATEDQKRFILDVYIALLYKYKKTALIISTLKSLSLKEGLELLKRFAHKRVNISKIWRHSNRIAHLAAQVYITATVMKPPEESVSILEALLETWFSLNETTENLESLMSAIRRIVQAAESAVHLYIFCEAVHKKFGLAMKTFIIELYIRALTTGMNDLERQKNEDDTVKVVETTQQLAHGFLRLAEVLEEHVKVSRECVLTSFSLQPTHETLERIVRLAERSGYELLDTGQNWKCNLHPPIQCTDEICWKCDKCGDFMSQPQFKTPLNTNTALNEALTAEQLGLSSQLCDDLVVVLSSPRYQLFNWLLRWQDLHRLCVLYLNDPEGTKNLVTELKFLDIDYSIFVGMKREPEDEELTGIERGYEHYLEDELYPEERISPTSEDSISQDSRPYSLGSDGMGEHASILPLPPSGKSDPNVLKSLRLFRPNLKRSKPNQLESVLPPKVFVTSKSVSPLTTAQTTISTAQHSMGSVENLSALMDKYIGGYSLLPTQPPKTFLTTKSVSPHTTAQPTFSTPHHNVRRNNLHALMDKYLGYDTSRNITSDQPRTSVGGRSGNWVVLGQCSSSTSSSGGRSSVVANSSATKEESFLNSTRERYNFLVSNSNVQQDRQCSVNSSRLDNVNVEPQKPSMKQMFTEMEQALDYLKQHKNEKVLETSKTENSSRSSLNLTKENSNNQQNVYRNLNENLPDSSRKPEQSNNFIGESRLTTESNSVGKLGSIKNTLEDNAEVNRLKCDRSGSDYGENSNMQNFPLDHKNFDSPEKQSIPFQKNSCANSDCSERQTASRIKIDENSYTKSSCAIPVSSAGLSKNIKPFPSSNTENGQKHCSVIQNSCAELSKNVSSLSNDNTENLKELPANDVSLPNVDISKNLSFTSSNTEDHSSHSSEVSFCNVETSKTVLPSVSDNERNKENHIEMSKNVLSSDDDGENKQNRDSDVPISDVEMSKNVLLSPSVNEEYHCPDVPHSVNISKNLISASSGTDNGELRNTLPVPCVYRSKNLTFGTSDAKNEENHCLHEMKSIDYKTSSEKHLIQEVENVVPTNAPKTYLRKYSRAKVHSASSISDSESTVLERDKSIDLKKKFNIKEVHVILHRLSLSECYKKKYIKPASKFVTPAVPKRKQPKREQKKVTEKSENKAKDTHKRKADIDNKIKNGSKPWPLQDINPKVNHRKDTKPHIFKDNKCKIDLKTDVKLMNPCVVLKRLEFDKDKRRSANLVLANVPGLNDLQMIRPSSVDRIVQVVQVPGARNTTSVPIQNTQTSTQVTPHIQRIGQPRTEKPEAIIPDSTSIASTAASSSSTTTTTSESPTLINILSQQIIRPNSQGNCVAVRPRTSPLINILSQQIIKPATSIPPSSKVSSSGSTEVQVNSIPRVITGGDQILSQLINPVRAPAPTLKTLVNTPASDHNRIVQFICKSSDGKLIPVTSFTSNKVVKVSMTQTVSTSVAGSASGDENYTKLAQITPKIKTEAAENSDTLPKFQQAFGKPAYQNNVDSTDCVTSNSDNVNSDLEKSVNVVKNQPKNSSPSLNVQPVQGGVIYTRQMPVGQTINLIPPGRGQVFRIATSNAEQLSLVKDTVIHGKMSALLAAALQGKQQRTVDNELDTTSEENSQSSTRVALTTRPALVQNARIVKPVLQIPSNVIRSTPQSNLSSTTLEQLREFDMVYKQVKERSSTSAPTESSPQSDSNEPTQQISVTYLNQGQKINCAPVVVVSSYCNVQPAASPSLSVTSQGSSSPCVTPAPTLALSKTVSKSPKTKSVKSATTHTTKASPIPKPQQKPQEDEHTTQRIFDILAEYAEQLRNSPDLNNKPAPRRRSNPPTNPNQNAKRKKSSSSKKTGHCSNSLASDGDLEDTHTVGSEDSSCGVVQISVQEEEQPLTAVSTSETSEASVSPKQLILTDSTPNQSRSLIIADSNVGEAFKMSNTAVLVPGNYIMPVSMVKGGQQIAVVSGGSKILATVPARSGPNMLLFQSFLNQTRKHGLPTVKYSAVQPISGIARNLCSVAAQAPTTITPTSQNLTAVTLAQTVALQKINQLDRADINSFDTELLLTIAHPPEIKNNITEQPQSEHRGISSSSESVQSIRVGDSILNTESSLGKAFSYEQKSLVNASVATSVIAQSISIKEEKLSEEQTTTQTIMALNLNSSDSDKDTTVKVEGRVQSVLVATGTSNGPMLFNSPATYNKQTDSANSISESNKDEYLRNEGKRISNEAKSLQSTVYAYQGKIKKNQASSHRLDRELQQLSLQRKQAALERELRLQKSLSEECEDLGVDEPSTSDLFPEADLLFDSNHSPSFDQSSQDLVKRPPNTQEIKEETKTIGLFCDDEPMRTDFLFEPIEFQSAAVELDYSRSRDMTNGQGSTSNESGYSCEDNTLLQTCTSMSDVTIPSPISPDPYTDNSPPPLNKCKYKYSNRKKAERSKQVENWPMELSSSEDTTGSTELAKSCSRSPEIYPGRRNRSLSCEEDDRDLIGFAIVERLPLKEDEECEELHCQEAIDCPSGRGARRSVKKLCSCCNGSTKVARKRPASRPPTPFSHKKTVIAKKR